MRSVGNISVLFVLVLGWLFGSSVPSREPQFRMAEPPVTFDSLFGIDSSLADTARNRIGGNRAALDSLFAKMRRVRSGAGEVVRMLHLGDSHVQAGFFPDAVRERLQAVFGNAGRGLVAPLRLMGTNEPPGYSILSPNAWSSARCAEMHPELSVGLTGVAIATRESAVGFTIRSTDGPFDRVVAFHHARAPLLRPGAEFSTDLSCPSQDTEESTLIPLLRSTDSVELKAVVCDTLYSVPEFYGFSLENGDRGVLYHYAGVNGNSYGYMERSPRMTEQSALLMPDLVVVSLGTNDSYGRNFRPEELCGTIRAQVERIRKSNPRAAVLLTVPMECYSRRRVKGRWVRSANPNLPKVRACILQVAEELGLPYWDFYEVTGGRDAMARWYRAQMAGTDRIHLTKEGYRLQGELFFRALADAYNSFAAGDSVPGQPVCAVAPVSDRDTDGTK